MIPQPLFALPVIVVAIIQDGADFINHFDEFLTSLSDFDVDALRQIPDLLEFYLFIYLFIYLGFFFWFFWGVFFFVESGLLRDAPSKSQPCRCDSDSVLASEA